MKAVAIVCVLFLVSCAQREPQKGQANRETRSESVPVKLSVVDQLYVSEGELLTLISVPSPLMPDSPDFGNQCLLYRNSDGVVALNCDLE